MKRRTERQRAAARRWGGPDAVRIYPADAPVTASAWERLLKELGLTERQALKEIGAGSDAGKRLRRFVKRNCHRRYVPERVLEACGMERAAREAVEHGRRKGIAWHREGEAAVSS